MLHSEDAVPCPMERWLLLYPDKLTKLCRILSALERVRNLPQVWRFLTDIDSKLDTRHDPDVEPSCITELGT